MRLVSLGLKLAVCVCAIWIGAIPGTTQVPYSQMNLATGNLNLGRISLAERSGRTSSNNGIPPNGEPNTARSAGVGASRLNFVSSPAVSERMHETMGQLVLAHTAPAQQPAMRQRWATFQPVAGFNSVIAKNGFSPNNLADVAAAYWILCWQIVHGGPDPDQETIRAVVTQLRGSLEQNSTLMQWTDEQKQKLAESMAYEVVLGLTGVRGAEAQHQQEMADGVRSDIANQFQQMAGMDLHKLELTPTGFVQK